MTAASLGKLESQRFGLRIHRCDELSAAMIPALLRDCTEAAADLLIARCAADDLDCMRLLQQHGGRLAGTVLTYRRDPAAPVPEAPPAQIRPATPSDSQAVIEVARAAFASHVDHYRADDRLSHEADEIYPDWAGRLCRSQDDRSAMFVAVDGPRLVAFAGVEMTAGRLARYTVAGVHPDHRGRGLYRALMMTRLKWGVRRGAVGAIISGHLANLGAQRIWIDVGFRPVAAAHTFHVWFDGD